MIDVDKLCLYVFENYHIRLDRDDPQVISALLNQAILAQFAEAFDRLVQEGLEQSKALGQDVMVVGAAGAAQEIATAVAAAVKTLNETVMASVVAIQAAQSDLERSHQALLERMQAYEGRMANMYSHTVWLSYLTSFTAAAGLFASMALIKGWI